MPSLTNAPLQVVETKSSLVLETPRSLGEVAVVPPTPAPQTSYERALDLMAKTRRQIASVATVKGPTVAPSVIDTWLKKNEGLSAVPAMLAMCSGVVSLVAGAAVDGSPTVSMNAGIVAAASVPPFFYMFTAGWRLKRAEAKHAAEVLDTADLDRMLASVREATPAERGMIEPFLNRALRPLDPGLSAKAAKARDRLMKDLPQPHGATARAAQLAVIVDDLAHGGELRQHLSTLKLLLLEAPVDELPILAANLETATFEGEKAIVEGSQDSIRELYAMIDAAKHGEALER